MALAGASARAEAGGGSWASLRRPWEPSKGRFECWVGTGRSVHKAQRSCRD